MALRIQFTSFNKTHHLPHPLLLYSSPKTHLTVKSQQPSESSKPTTNVDDTISAEAPLKKLSSSGQGFGSSSSSKSDANTATGNRNGRSKRERASIIRRSPVEKPAFVSEEDKGRVKEQSRNESAFLLTWLGLGAVILVEGLILAASGFLPEEWDKFFVKYLYPSFTPTVVLFVAGTVVYGVLKYLQNQEITGQK
ncbi:protein LOW PSII ACCUMULATION 2, chloroplastic [Quillaja saponaria]|uniref:Protein LOW PSII ACCUMULATION 2, chloroplastic n=1 Tax=Quillaja saponaria TaxID=32244 RepID=A0AAD7L1R6_QUISA|nr:protein LOW PSII ACCUMULATION 2, chloroplastic [Quillaja saponaria]